MVGGDGCTVRRARHELLHSVEYIEAYFGDRLDPEAFARRADEQMAAYEETEVKVH